MLSTIQKAKTLHMQINLYCVREKTRVKTKASESFSYLQSP